MTADNWLRHAQSQLKVAGIATARLDCLVLLEDATGNDRGWLLAHPEFELPAEVVDKLDTDVLQRVEHVPLAYIRGNAEFYGREFVVNEHTLVPRPETEAMIDMLKHVAHLESDITAWEDGGRKRSGHRRDHQGRPAQSSALVHTDDGYKLEWSKATKRLPGQKTPKRENLSSNDTDFHLIDIGTGSGAIAITAKLELPEAQVAATDIDEKCLETAGINAGNLSAEITLLKGNLLEPVTLDPSLISVLLCNLPYVPDNFQINTAATHEPRHALFGGADGLDLYRELFGQIAEASVKPQYVATESLPPQHEVLTGIAKVAGYSLRKTDDFIQLFELSA